MPDLAKLIHLVTVEQKDRKLVIACRANENLCSLYDVNGNCIDGLNSVEVLLVVVGKRILSDTRQSIREIEYKLDSLRKKESELVAALGDEDAPTS